MKKKQLKWDNEVKRVKKKGIEMKDRQRWYNYAQLESLKKKIKALE